jgi:hypothetical protein
MEEEKVSKEVNKLGGPIFDKDIEPRARNVVKYSK